MPFYMLSSISEKHMSISPWTTILPSEFSSAAPVESHPDAPGWVMCSFPVPVGAAVAQNTHTHDYNLVC